MENFGTGADRWCGLAAYAGVTIFAACITVKSNPGMAIAAGLTFVAIGEWLNRRKRMVTRHIRPNVIGRSVAEYWHPRFIGICFDVAGVALLVTGLLAQFGNVRLMCGAQ